ncbi:glycosyltransferase family 4 protein [Leptospira kanakyensis]|uniref:glycosyltransferase family 4 protein n=1 Tax=Leptospira kanakyensis TaxID=2484968 RepID=UPI00223E2A1D|nr:glycosyltransferase family 4 protein [Leptospira kanakyensis]MCW7482124.1 glycosyltransferase family 4 protein [Leptospira kanakyensis]
MQIGIWWDQDSWGGVDSHMLNLLNYWPNETDSFVIFHNLDNKGFHRIKNKFSKSIKLTSVPFVSKHSEIFLIKVLRNVFFPLVFLLVVLKNYFILRKYKYLDAIICNNGNYPGSLSCLATIVSSKLVNIKKRLLLIHHEAQPRRVFISTFEHLLDNLMQRYSSDIVCVSRATRKTLIDRRGFFTVRNPIRVIHNGVSLDRTNSLGNVHLRNDFGIEKEDVVIGMVGRVERYKGHEDLLFALSDLDSELSTKIKVIIVGSYEEAEKKRLLNIGKVLSVKSEIFFTGYLDVNIQEIIRQFDLLAMLTKDFEGFGLTIAEAMVVETPVLATCVGGVSEFTDNDSINLIPPESPDSIRLFLEGYFKNRKVILSKVKNAKKNIRNFSADSMSKKFYNLIKV